MKIKMYNILLVALIALFSNVVVAQNNQFAKYESNKAVTFLKLGPEVANMLESYGLFATKDSDFKDLSKQFKNIKNLKLYITEDLGVVKEITNTIQNLTKSKTVEEIMSVNEGGDLVKIYATSSSLKSKEKELYLFVQSNKIGEKKNVLINLIGDFDLSKLN